MSVFMKNGLSLQHDEKAITIGMRCNAGGMPWLRQKEEGGANETCA
jgi:hypothetical protein